MCTLYTVIMLCFIFDQESFSKMFLHWPFCLARFFCFVPSFGACGGPAVRLGVWGARSRASLLGVRSVPCAFHMFWIGGLSVRWMWIWAPSLSFSTVVRWACRVANSHWSVRQVGSLSLRSTLPHPRCLLLCPCHFASEHRELLGRWRTAVVF
jgi:hypothetical protein